uniref:MFS domain-containing protein n=1 Tax=Mesocestoides corti TaxID=53468 RepID=A0A5K3FTB1_MESCO
MDKCQKLDGVLPLRLRQVIGIVFGSIEMLFFGGIIFGFNALIPVLQKESIYSHLCQNITAGSIGCNEQVTMYGYAFTTYMVVQMVLLFIVGFLVDHVGLRIVKLSASILFSIGAVLFGIANSANSWVIFPAGICVCVGGMAGLICNFSISKLFNKTSTLVLALITGSYDAASSVFAVFAVAYGAGYSYNLTFFLLAGVGLAMNLFSSLFVTTYRMSDMSVFRAAINSSAPEDKSVEVIMMGDTEKADEEASVETSLAHEGQISKMLHEFYPTVLTSLRSLPFILITCFFSFAMVRFTFFLTQFSILMEDHFPGQPETVMHLSQTLSFALAGGILAGVTCGSSIDFLRARMHSRVAECLALGAKSSVFWLRLCPHAAAMVVVTVAATCLSALVFIASPMFYYVNFFFLVVMRGFLFSTISAFIMTAFPIEQFGTLYGISGSLAGAFSCIQYALLSPTVKVANLISFFFVPLMGAVPSAVLVKAFTTWRQRSRIPSEERKL